MYDDGQKKVGELIVRVLHIMSGYGGGISSFIRNQAQYLHGGDVVFDVVTYDDCAMSFVEMIRQTGGDVYTLINPKRYGWRAFRQSFVEVLRKHQYDVVHCHIQGYRVIPYYMLCRFHTHAKFYIHGHYTKELSGSSWTLSVHQWLNRQMSQAYLGCSDEAIYTAYGKTVPTHRMMVIPNSIDEQLLLQEQELTTSQDITIAHIGRLASIKNHSFTLQLAHYAKKQGIRCKWLIVGAGELEEQLRLRIEQLSLQDVVSMVGRVEPISDIYRRVDAIVLPSLREGLPTVAIESQAAGTPIIVSNTITREVDIQVGLIHYMPIKQDEQCYQDWLAILLQSVAIDKPTVSQRLEVLERMYFTNRTAATLYQSFLKGEVVQYRIATH